jgi:EAL domain-containing protein (putative c-di-GMP-specific phosphodiesterase class I)
VLGDRLPPAPKTLSQIEIIRQLGAFDIQGYAVAPPMDGATMAEWLARRQAFRAARG